MHHIFLLCLFIDTEDKNVYVKQLESIFVGQVVLHLELVSNDCSIIVCRRGLKKPIVQVFIVVVDVSCYGQQSSVAQNNIALACQPD